MSKWVAAQLKELLLQINEVPFTDEREKEQLTILIGGFAELNSRAMGKAADKTREQMRNWSIEDDRDEEEEEDIMQKSGEDSSDELTRLRPLK